MDFDGLIVDLDGVVWLGGEPIAGAVEALSALRARGIRLVFLTNDPRSSRAEYAARLQAIGVDIDERDIVSAGNSLAALVAEREGKGATTFVIGSPSLKSELTEAGLDLVEGDAARRVDVVAVGGHDDFDFHELLVATQALRAGARLYAAGRDAVFPKPDGPWPGTGAIVAAVEVAGGRAAIAAGKPEPFIFDRARALLKGCSRVAIVGDSLASDIAGGNRAGLSTILVLSGVTSHDDVSSADVEPDVVLDSLANLSR